MQSDMMIILSCLCDGDMHRKELFGETGVNVCVHYLRTNPKLLNSGLGHHRLLLTAVDCVWCAIVGCYGTEDYLLEKEGVFLLIDLLEACPKGMHNLILGCLLDLCENPKTVHHVLTWRGKDNTSAAHLFCDIWRNEERDIGVKRDQCGAIIDVKKPLMSSLQEQQGFTPLPASCPSQAIVDVSENMRAKLYSLFCKIGFTDLPGLTVDDHITLTVIEKYLDFKHFTEGERGGGMFAEFWDKCLDKVGGMLVAIGRFVGGRLIEESIAGPCGCSAPLSCVTLYAPNPTPYLDDELHLASQPLHAVAFAGPWRHALPGKGHNTPALSIFGRNSDRSHVDPRPIQLAENDQLALGLLTLCLQGRGHHSPSSSPRHTPSGNVTAPGGGGSNRHGEAPTISPPTSPAYEEMEVEEDVGVRQEAEGGERKYEDMEVDEMEGAPSILPPLTPGTSSQPPLAPANPPGLFHPHVKRPAEDSSDLNAPLKRRRIEEDQPPQLPAPDDRNVEEHEDGAAVPVRCSRRWRPLRASNRNGSLVKG